MIVNAQARLDSTEKAIASIETKLKEAVETNLVVSEHALLRYLERVEGVNLEEVRKKVLGVIGDTVIDGIHAVGTHKIRVKDGTVVTIIT